jgi:hypothetical protein
MATTLLDTFDSVTLDSAAGRKFLRRVVNRPGEDWRFWASEDTQWVGEFRRTVEAKAGDTRAVVTIATDHIVGVYGKHGTVGEDGDVAVIPAALFVHADGGTVATLLLAGFRLRLSYCRGSIASRAEGLAFVSLDAVAPGKFLGVEIESVTTKNGRPLCGTSFCFAGY